MPECLTMSLADTATPKRRSRNAEAAATSTGKARRSTNRGRNVRVAQNYATRSESCKRGSRDQSCTGVSRRSGWRSVR